METKGSLIFKKANLLLNGAAVLPAELLHKIETIADDTDYTDEDVAQAENHKAQADYAKRSMTDLFLSRVANEDYPDDPVKEIMQYINQASSGVVTLQWVELSDYISELLDPEENPVKKANRIAEEKLQREAKKAATKGKKVDVPAADVPPVDAPPADVTPPVDPAK